MSRSVLRNKLPAALLLFVAVLACKSLQSPDKSTILNSPDGKFQLTVPAGWREHAGLNDKADIKAASLIDEMYVIVITEAKLDFTDEMTLDQYTTISRDSMVSNLAASDATPPVPVTISGNAGRQYEIQGAVENVRLAYLVTTVETAAHYHQIITWTLRSRINENQMTLQQVTETFRPTPG